MGLFALGGDLTVPLATAIGDGDEIVEYRRQALLPLGEALAGVDFSVIVDTRRLQARPELPALERRVLFDRGINRSELFSDFDCRHGGLLDIHVATLVAAYANTSSITCPPLTVS